MSRVKEGKVYSVCQNCGISFLVTRNSFGKYCSNKCQRLHQRPAFEDLKTDRSRRLRLIEERGYCCWECGISDWRQKPIVLELDHLDGDSGNNARSNLRIVCPNCHSQTTTYKAKNKGFGRKHRKSMRE